MKNYIAEVDANFDAYFAGLESEVGKAFDSLKNCVDKYKESYRRLVSFQGWRQDVFAKVKKPEAAAFFTEAHNDLLMSHALARQAAWRVALMSLRSAIENTLFSLYYLDHPVELIHWRMGRHRLGFSEVVDYLSRHPNYLTFKETETGLGQINKEYATLSKAVHGSSGIFRVTKDGDVKGLHVPTTIELNKWITREKAVVTSLNLILIIFFRSEIKGAGNLNLRKAISLAIPNSRHAAIKSKFGVTLRNIPADCA